jgi:two-component system phosphate regulon response regulator PhoB
LRSVRAVGGDRMPVVFVSSDNSEAAAVRAFAAGVDDYVALPVRPAEFRERISALLRRAYPDRHRVASFDAGPYHFDAHRQLVTLRGEPVQLSGTQHFTDPRNSYGRFSAALMQQRVEPTLRRLL